MTNRSNQLSERIAPGFWRDANGEWTVTPCSLNGGVGAVVCVPSVRTGMGWRIWSGSV